MHADNVEYKVQTIATVSAVGTGASEKKEWIKPQTSTIQTS